MKIFSLLIMASIMAFSMEANAQEKKVVMYADDVNFADDDQADLVINMNYQTDTNVAGFNIYLSLPQGIDLYFDDEEEDYVYTVSTAFITKKLSKWFGIKTVAGLERTYMLYYIDQDNMTPMKTTEGELLTISLTATDEASDQSVGTLYDIALTDASNTSLDLGNIADYNFNITVDTSTAIREINTNEEGGDVYSISGQRILHPTKGIFVMKGKKVIR